MCPSLIQSQLLRLVYCAEEISKCKHVSNPFFQQMLFVRVARILLKYEFWLCVYSLHRTYIYTLSDFINVKKASIAREVAFCQHISSLALTSLDSFTDCRSTVEYVSYYPLRLLRRRLILTASSVKSTLTEVLRPWLCSPHCHFRFFRSITICTESSFLKQQREHNFLWTTVWNGPFFYMITIILNDSTVAQNMSTPLQTGKERWTCQMCPASRI